MKRLQLTPEKYKESLRDHHKQLYANKMDNLEETQTMLSPRNVQTQTMCLLEMYNLPRQNQEEI